MNSAPTGTFPTTAAHPPGMAAGPPPDGPPPAEAPPGGHPAVGGSRRVRRFRREVARLRIDEPRARFDVYRARLGGVLMVLGIVLGIVGYVTSHSTVNPLQQRDAVDISLVGVAVTVSGAAIFLRYSFAGFLRFWLARLLFEQQERYSGGGTDTDL